MVHFPWFIFCAFFVHVFCMFTVCPKWSHGFSMVYPRIISLFLCFTRHFPCHEVPQRARLTPEKWQNSSFGQVLGGGGWTSPNKKWMFFLFFFGAWTSLDLIGDLGGCGDSWGEWALWFTCFFWFNRWTVFCGRFFSLEFSRFLGFDMLYMVKPNNHKSRLNHEFAISKQQRTATKHSTSWIDDCRCPCSWLLFNTPRKPWQNKGFTHSWDHWEDVDIWIYGIRMD